MFRRRTGQTNETAGNGMSFRGKMGQFGKKAGTLAAGLVIVILAANIVLGSVYSLKENEYAVVTTFGVPSIVDEPGIHVKIPVVQALNKVPKTINGFPIGYGADGNTIDSESFMITRDYNFVNVDLNPENADSELHPGYDRSL